MADNSKNGKVTLRNLYDLSINLNHKIDNLPCKIHDLRISNLEKVNERNRNNERMLESRGYSRKTQVIAALIGVIGTLIAILLTHNLGWLPL